eukprot:TRINITY_DN9534_c0_g4_i3.p1 TRINITY_DN9534_c0_g4~~TRINITY_DN9534_c0_g4_i3.p1  ORF type:complete len:202 (-),score=25.02 TRINITY_DN9534_c0_g4_i3:56-661(-)
MSHTIVCLVLSLFLLRLANANADVYMIKVEPKSEDCFYEDLEKGDSVRFEHHVVDGGLLDVEIRLFFKTTIFHKVLYFEGKDQSTYSFYATDSGPHAFCFNNEMSRWTVKTVTFSLITTKNSFNKTEILTPFEKTVERIETDLENIEKEQSNYRVREHMHRNTAETTNTRVYLWSLIESGILFVMCVGQVFYLKSLFDTRR